MSRFRALAVVALLVAGIPGAAWANPSPVSAAGPISFTILHTNDVHGQLEASGSNPGVARVAAVVNGVRASLGAANVLLADGGDEMQGSLLSNLQKGVPTIASFNATGYDVATFGNHEFDWGQGVLTDRTNQATYPFVSANIVQKGTAADCASAGWASPSFAQPWVIKTVGTAPDQVKVGFIGVTTQETPTITIASATAGLCFKDPADSIVHYYDTMKTAGADVVVVLSHLGFNDGGYGYGIPVYGDKTLAQKLITAGKAVPLIIGGHSHTDLGPLFGTPLPAVLPADFAKVGSTAVVQAYYNGRRVGDASMTFDPASKAVTVGWKSLIVDPAGAEDAAVKAVVTSYSSDPAYQALINQPVGYTQVDLLRNYNGDNMMGDFVDDAIYNALNSDATAANDIDLFFNNAGGIRTDWCAKADAAHPGSYLWSSTAADCTTSGVWSHSPMLMTYGQMFNILPFGNATVVGTMTGAQILEALNQSATLGKGAIQPAGIKFNFYRYSDSKPGPQPWAWGATNACVMNRTTHLCEPLDLTKTYRVGTNEFLAPAGGDNYGAFKYMNNVTYWGDMLNLVNSYVTATYTAAHPYKGPNGDGTLDGRITRDGTDAGGSVVPITILHNNDSHGNLAKGAIYPGMTQLATLIQQERQHNPGRTILLNGGDQIQGDAMSYFFKTAPTGFASDGTPLPPALQTNPMMAVMNALGYDAMTLGNHEFNFGGAVFSSVLNQAKFAILGANVADDGTYGLAAADGGKGVQPYIEKNLGGVNVAILGITNHRVPNYELPSNIRGLSFGDPIVAGETYAPELKATNDIVVALTHIGFTTNPKSVEVDNNVDTTFAAQVPGVDAIVGAHSHTNPKAPEAPYKYLPTIVAGPGNTPVLVSQAYRYNNTLGEEVIGVRPKIQLTIEDVQRLYDLKAIDSAGIRSSLLDKLTYAKSLLDAGQTTSALSQLNAFINAVNAQSGKHITKAAAATLVADATWMIANKGGYGVVARAGQYLTVTMDTPEDPAIKAIVDPYVAALGTYQNKVVGQTTVPIDTTDAYVAETNAANLQADASVAELASHGITDVDVHLSGAMTQSSPKVLFASATSLNPVTLKVSDMFTLMPYENSLVVLSMNGPQIKAVLERAYRNYYYYKYVSGYGGYSYYTTCMLDTNAVGQITYNEKKGGAAQPPLPDGSNVVSLKIGGVQVDFSNATKFYNVSTVNYLAAGSCNFNDNGVSLWPLNQIVHDTQFYVRDAVIDYVTAQGTVSPAVTGRVQFISNP